MKIQEKGEYKVTIIAETFPTDPKTIKYTSLWAVSITHPSWIIDDDPSAFRERTMSAMLHKT